MPMTSLTRTIHLTPNTSSDFTLHYDSEQFKFRTAISMASTVVKYQFIDVQTSKRYYLSVERQTLTQGTSPIINLVIKRIKKSGDQSPFKAFIPRFTRDEIVLTREFPITVTLMEEE